ncbi:MAG: amidohydrolase/deacetylase family metallohydrolase [Planctomycetota bacterium]|jgi:dihydroorotase|nr:amidohydrolase/deacetylase family metallohydrolase [Planctomycetota bacterium]
MSEGYVLKNLRPAAFPGMDGTVSLDIAVKEGRVAGIGRELPAGNSMRTADFQGALVSPAWIDMHTHVYWGSCDIAARPRDIGAATGTPILVDAGSAGEGNFPGFREFIIKPARERVIPFLNVGSIGLVATNRVPEVRLLSDIDPARIIRTLESEGDLIRGLKVRLCGIINSETDILPLKLAKKLSRVLGLPLMVHIGLPPPLIEEVLDLLEEGDILTHCYHGKPAGSLSDDPIAFAAAERARARGVFFDLGHGSASFSRRVGLHCLTRGFAPDTLGSDLYAGNLNGPVWDLSLVMSKMLALGMDFSRVLDGVTRAPRRALRLPEADLAPGTEAAFTIFDLAETELNLPDSQGESVEIRKRFVPKAVFWRGELSEASSRRPEAGTPGGEFFR